MMLPDNSQRYFADGFITIPFDARPLIDATELALNSVPIHTPDERGYFWASKYPNTLDFRPSVISYDDLFVDILMANDIPAILHNALQTDDVTLTHCQLRYVVPLRDGSYMPWHRDTYFDGKTWIGPTPAANKLIIYLDPDNRAEPRLSVYPGSHRNMSDDMATDMPRQLTAQQTVHASNTSAFIFNTALLHSTLPEMHKDGSVRIIYSFTTHMQYIRLFANTKIHALAHDEYQMRNV